MKAAMNFLERGYAANLYRIRAEAYSGEEKAHASVAVLQSVA